MTSETKLRDLERDLKQAIADFNTLQSRPSKKLPSPLFALVHQLPSIARRAFSPGPGIDGFSGGSSLGGGRGGGPKIKVPNEDGDDELVEVTTVEAAMFALDAAARNPSAREGDPVGTIGARATRLFVVAVAALKAAKEAASDFYMIESDTPYGQPFDAPTACELCIEAELPVPRAWETVGDVGGRLPKKTYLCGPCRTYIEKRDEMPSVEQRKQYDLTGRWKIRTDGPRR